MSIYIKSLQLFEVVVKAKGASGSHNTNGQCLLGVYHALAHNLSALNQDNEHRCL